MVVALYSRSQLWRAEIMQFLAKPFSHAPVAQVSPGEATYGRCIFEQSISVLLTMRWVFA